MNKGVLVAVAVAALGLTGTWPAASAAPEARTGDNTLAAGGQGQRAVKDVPASKYGSYVVLLKADALISTYHRKQLSSPAAVRDAQRLRDSHDALLQETRIGAERRTQSYTGVVNGFSFRGSQAQATRLAAHPAVLDVFADELRQATSIAADNVDDGTSRTEEEFLGLAGEGQAHTSGVTGERVLVGVIDTGIWPEHPSFADDGSYPKPPQLNARGGRPKCDFGQKSHNKVDVSFGCNGKLVAARQMLDSYRALVGAESWEFDSARDDNGHGTHTASTAAGNAGVEAHINERFIDTTSGVAPRAQIIAYKGLGALGGFTSDLAGAIDQAVTDGVDVINYSIGGGPGLVGADTIAYLFAHRAGVFVAASAGNSGPNPGTIGGPADVPWLTTVGASTQERYYEGLVTLGNGTTIQGASVTRGMGVTQIVDAASADIDPKNTVSSALCVPGELDPVKVAGKIVLCQRGQIGRVAKSLAVKQAGGVGMVMFNIDTPQVDNHFTDNFWVPTSHIDERDGRAIKTYIASAGAAATAKIDVGKITSTPWDVPSMTIFSSRGPNPSAASIIKPDITAPGIQVLAGASPSVDPESPQGHLFQSIAGTSMSSPQIAGMFALLKQAHPEWTASEAKSALQTTAHTDVRKNDRVTPADPFDFGAGHVNAGVVAEPGMFNPGLVYPAGFNDYLGFLCDAGPEAFADPAATCAALAGAGVPTRTEDLNLATIGISKLAGTETVKRRVKNVSGSPLTVSASSSAPTGYSVTVTPSTLTLAPGETKSFQVTVSNTGAAPVGVWRFGSLTWSGEGFSARSNIAVKGAAIATPSVVEGTGASGTANIPVKFGYSGSYSAQAGGLVGSSPRAFSVGQDPDQTYPSADDDQGGVVKIPLPLSNISYARLELAIPGDDDIDLFLHRPDGRIIASSTSGGTDELIELHNPADGTYTLAVHGWAVSSPPLVGNVSAWLVPKAAGTLQVTSAPAAAVISQTGTVKVAWTGATPAGTPFYGAVNHVGPSGVMAQTVVKVTG